MRNKNDCNNNNNDNNNNNNNSNINTNLYIQFYYPHYLLISRLFFISSLYPDLPSL